MRFYQSMGEFVWEEDNITIMNGSCRCNNRYLKIIITIEDNKKKLEFNCKHNTTIIELLVQQWIKRHVIK